MSSVVDICNLALSHLGDVATVASIDPPEGSAQAEHCARFYPVARDAVLESHDWNFATRRASLALLAEENDQWDYVYAKPNMMRKAIAVLPPTASGDYEAPPQPYAIETISSGVEVVATNQESAVLRYTVSVTDPTRFPALVVLAMSHYLAALLAGPIIKGEKGAEEAKRQTLRAESVLALAKEADANQQKIQVTHTPPWISGR